MNWIESIKYIKEAQRNNRLVIFVGAGVSKNSGIPMWGELIRAIADEIKYNHCTFCKEEANIKCKERYNFTQDEYLKIPEYFYRLCMQNDEQTGDKTYYDFIKKTLHTDVESNCIDDIIFQLLPHHIITTNYDTLLEDSTDVNARLYTTIKEDGDLLSSSNDHYIIKMHGDFSNPANLVLKESDYINYEQTHILISTYIRSLLIDHTFLFVGYSLNDYNLKLIMGWINYFVEKHGVTKRPYNFLIQHGEANFFESKLYEAKNIYVIDTEPILQNYDVKSINLQNPFGQSLYAFLSIIKHDEKLIDYIALEDILYDRCLYLKTYNKIGYDDFLEMIKDIDKYARIENYILILDDEKVYNLFINMISANNKKSELVKKTMQKVDIRRITYQSFYKNVFYELEDSVEYPVTFQMYLDNEYRKLFHKLKCDDSIDELIYYTSFIDFDSNNSDTYLKKKHIENNDIVTLLHYKLQEFYCKVNQYKMPNANEIYRLFEMIPKELEFSIYSFKEILSMDKRTNHLKKSIESLERKYIKEAGSQVMLSSTYFASIQSEVYDTYMFCHKNHIPTMYSNHFMNYYTLYIQAILCTYHVHKDERFYAYELNELDIDIFTKFTLPDKIEKWIKKYGVQKLYLSAGIDITTKFKNFCEAYHFYHHRFHQFTLYAFLMLLDHLEISDKDFHQIVKSYFGVLESHLKEHAVSNYKLQNSLSYFIIHFHERLNTSEADALLQILFTDFLFEENRHYQRLNELDYLIINHASSTVKAMISNEIMKIKDEDKLVEGIQCFSDCFQQKDLEKLVYQYLYKFEPLHICNLIVLKKITYQEEIQQYFVNKINVSYEKHTMSFVIEGYIDYCIKLYLCNFPFDLLSLKDYVKYSKRLAFILNPDKFDYSLVDLYDPSWQIFFSSDKTLSDLYRHREEILTDKIKKELRQFNPEMNRYLILFGKLFTFEELKQLVND